MYFAVKSIIKCRLLLKLVLKCFYTCALVADTQGGGRSREWALEIGMLLIWEHSLRMRIRVEWKKETHATVARVGRACSQRVSFGLTPSFYLSFAPPHHTVRDPRSTFSRSLSVSFVRTVSVLTLAIPLPSRGFSLTRTAVSYHESARAFSLPRE